MAPHTRLRLRVSPGTLRPGTVGRRGKAWKLRVSATGEGLSLKAAEARLGAAADESR